MSKEEFIRIYVGADRSQALAVQVLEHSIKRHTSAAVQVIPMIDLPVPVPKDPRNGQRTGFSFSRFCIPALAGYKGKAIYMDADMQVFKDIRELWSLSFNGAKVLIQEEVKHTALTMAKANAPLVRKKQCAVMLLDCERLDWNIENIVRDLDDGKYTYDRLMNDICILPEDEVGYGVPFEWNSLEYFDQNTCLIHYTDMGTQPWVSTRNPNGEVWFAEVRKMLANGTLDWDTLRNEIDIGHFRPSLLRDIRSGHRVPRMLRGLFNRTNEALDKLSGYVPHKAVYQAKSARNKAIKDYERAKTGLSS
jgi:lipopolysaccharide biosynthesis glycosyltransferase